MNNDLDSWDGFIEDEDDWDYVCDQDVIDDFVQTIGEIL